MKLKGTYASGTSYSVGDYVELNGAWYILRKTASAGTAPTDTKFWQQADPEDWHILDLMNGILGSVDTLYPDPKNIVLASSTDASTKKFKIKVVDNGTISATEIS